MKSRLCECCGEPISRNRCENENQKYCRQCARAHERKSQRVSFMLWWLPRINGATSHFTREARLHWRYAPDRLALDELWIHSRIVGTLACQLLARAGLPLDQDQVMRAALLHDIGIYRCMDWRREYQSEMSTYIRHGIVGAQVLRYEGFAQEYWRVAERHTGVGITRMDIALHTLELPERDYIPITLLEKLIAYSDKFHSKRDGLMSFAQVLKSQQRWGREKVARLLDLKERFGTPDLEPAVPLATMLKRRGNLVAVRTIMNSASRVGRDAAR